MVIRVLLHSENRDFFLMAGDASKTTLIDSTSDTRCKYEFIIRPLGLYWDTNYFMIFYRNLTLHTTSWIFHIATTALLPLLLKLCHGILKIVGVPGQSSLCMSSVFIECIADWIGISGRARIMTYSPLPPPQGFTFSTLFIEANKPSTAGIMRSE